MSDLEKAMQEREAAIQAAAERYDARRAEIREGAAKEEAQARQEYDAAEAQARQEYDAAVRAAQGAPAGR
jgi:hypothetical protein